VFSEAGDGAQLNADVTGTATIRNVGDGTNGVIWNPSGAANGSQDLTVSLGGAFAFHFTHTGAFTAPGAVNMPGLPTADPAVAGELWNNLGIVTVSAG
jgi:hypothetical protein